MQIGDDKSKTVRVSRELYDKASQLSHTLRPRTTIQYIIEDALITYLDKLAESDPNYRTGNDADKQK